MILNETIEIRINTSNFKYLKNKGYIFNKVGDKISISIKDLSYGSQVEILAMCDFCEKVVYVKYENYSRSTNNLKTKYSCYDCKSKKAKETNLERYGVDSPTKVEKFKEKIKKTNLERYGVEYSTQTDETKAKIAKTNLEKYGNICSLNHKDIKEKSKNTSKENYGVDHPMKSKIIKDKIAKTQLERYGGCNLNTVSLNDKKETWIKNYGVDNPSKSEIVKKKKLDKSNIKTVINFKNKYNIDITNIVRIPKKKKFFFDVINNNMCEHDTFNTSAELFRDRYKDNTILCTKCNDPLNNKISSFHLEIINHIKSFYPNKLIINDRKILNGNEIDILIPDLKIGIECNGLYWHSETQKEKYYHKIKYLQSKERDIHLIQIWGDNWISKKDLIKSMIKNLLSYNDNKLHSNQCNIRIVPDTEAHIFLEENYINNCLKTKYYIGLYYDEELVSLMVFNSRDNNDYNLLCFCDKKYYDIVDSEITLFNYFINNYDPSNIFYKNPLEWEDSELYLKLGMKNIETTDIEYVYVINAKRVNTCDVNIEELKDKYHYGLWNSGYSIWKWSK